MRAFNVVILAKIYQANCHDGQVSKYGYAHYLTLAAIRNDSRGE